MLWLRRNAWWILPELTVLIGLSVALTTSAPTLDDRLAHAVAESLERIPPTEHHAHGHDVGTGDRILCTAEVFGFEPRDATRLEDVTAAYATFLCAAGKPGTAWDWSSRLSGPVVVTLGPTPRVQIARSGSGYPERVKEMIPDDLEAQAFAGFRDHRRPADLRRRYESRIGGLT